MPNSQADVYVAIGANLDPYNKALKEAETTFLNMSKKFSKQGLGVSFTADLKQYNKQLTDAADRYDKVRKKIADDVIKLSLSFDEDQIDEIARETLKMNDKIVDATEKAQKASAKEIADHKIAMNKKADDIMWAGVKKRAAAEKKLASQAIRQNNAMYAKEQKKIRQITELKLAGIKVASNLSANEIRKLHKQEMIAIEQAAAARRRAASGRSSGIEDGNVRKHMSFSESTMVVAKYAVIAQGLMLLQKAFSETMRTMMDFDNMLYQNIAILNKTEAESRGLINTVKDLGIAYGGSFQEVQDGLLALGRAGVDSAEGLSAATKVLKELSLITGDSMADGAAIMSSLLNVFGRKAANEIKNTGDQLAYVANETRLGIKDFSTLANYALTSAKAIGLTQEAFLGLAGAFSKVGYNASTIGTSIRRLSKLVLDDTAANTEFFRVLGVEQKQFASDMRTDSVKAIGEFNEQLALMSDKKFSQAVSGMNVLLRQTVTSMREIGQQNYFKNMVFVLDNTTGEMKKLENQAKIMSVGFGVATERMFNQFKVSVGGVITDLASLATGFDGFTDTDLTVINSEIDVMAKNVEALLTPFAKVAHLLTADKEELSNWMFGSDEIKETGNTITSLEKKIKSLQEEASDMENVWFYKYDKERMAEIIKQTWEAEQAILAIEAANTKALKSSSGDRWEELFPKMTAKTQEAFDKSVEAIKLATGTTNKYTKALEKVDSTYADVLKTSKAFQNTMSTDNYNAMMMAIAKNTDAIAKAEKIKYDLARKNYAITQAISKLKNDEAKTLREINKLYSGSSKEQLATVNARKDMIAAIEHEKDVIKEVDELNKGLGDDKQSQLTKQENLNKVTEAHNDVLRATKAHAEAVTNEMSAWYTALVNANNMAQTMKASVDGIRLKAYEATQMMRQLAGLVTSDAASINIASAKFKIEQESIKLAEKGLAIKARGLENETDIAKLSKASSELGKEALAIEDRKASQMINSVNIAKATQDMNVNSVKLATDTAIANEKLAQSTQVQYKKGEEQLRTATNRLAIVDKELSGLREQASLQGKNVELENEITLKLAERNIATQAIAKANKQIADDATKGASSAKKASSAAAKTARLADKTAKEQMKINQEIYKQELLQYKIAMQKGKLGYKLESNSLRMFKEKAKLAKALVKENNKLTAGVRSQAQLEKDKTASMQAEYDLLVKMTEEMDKWENVFTDLFSGDFTGAINTAFKDVFTGLQKQIAEFAGGADTLIGSIAGGFTGAAITMGLDLLNDMISGDGGAAKLEAAQKTAKENATANSKTIENSLNTLTEIGTLGLGYSSKMVSSLTIIADQSLLASKNLTPSMTGADYVDKSTKGFWNDSETSLLESGIALNQTTIDQLNNGALSASEYMVEATENSGFLGIGSGVDIKRTDGGAVDPSILEPINNAYREGVELLKESTEALGVSAQEFNEASQAWVVSAQDLNFAGLDAQERAQLIQGAVAGDIDAWASSIESLQPIIEQYRIAGEGAGETIIRVTATYEVGAKAMRDMGATLPPLAEGGYEVADAMIKAAGGIDKFVEKQKKWNDAFMTEQQKNAINTRDLAISAQALNLTLPSTNQGMLDLHNKLVILSASSPEAARQLAWLDANVAALAQHASASAAQIGSAAGALGSCGSAAGSCGASVSSCGTSLEDAGQSAEEAAKEFEDLERSILSLQNEWGGTDVEDARKTLALIEKQTGLLGLTVDNFLAKFNEAAASMTSQDELTPWQDMSSALKGLQDATEAAAAAEAAAIEEQNRIALAKAKEELAFYESILKKIDAAFLGSLSYLSNIEKAAYAGTEAQEAFNNGDTQGYFDKLGEQLTYEKKISTNREDYSLDFYEYINALKVAEPEKTLDDVVEELSDIKEEIVDVKDSIRQASYQGA